MSYYAVNSHGGIDAPLVKAFQKAKQICTEERKDEIIFIADEKHIFENVIHQDKEIGSLFKQLLAQKSIQIDSITISYATLRTIPQGTSGIIILVYASPQLIGAMDLISGCFDCILVPWMKREFESFVKLYNANVIE